MTEKNSDSHHNFMDDPIRLVRQGDWLKVSCLAAWSAMLSCTDVFVLFSRCIDCDLVDTWSHANRVCPIKADGTTLGADNGIGVAAMLALLDAPKDAKLPPLEALFTVVSASPCLGKQHCLSRCCCRQAGVLQLC